MLTLEELRADVESGAIDTVVVAFTDMQGRLMGKRLHAEFFLDEMDAGHGVEGCNYLLALEMEMEPVPGYALASWEQGYGDFDVRPDLATLRRIPWLEATALVLGDVHFHDGSPVAAVAAPGAEGADGTSGCARPDADDGQRARVLPPPRDLRGGARQGVLRADAVGAVHPRLPHPRHDLRRGVPASAQERHARRRDARRDLEGRGLARAAGDQLPLRGRADDGGQPRHLQERCQGDRVPQRVLDHLHGEAVPGLDRQLVSHPLVALARRHAVLCDRRDDVLALAGRTDRVLQGARRSSSRRRSTRTSGSPRARGRRRRSHGGTTTARVASASSGTGRRVGRRPGSRAATRTRISRSPP